MHQKFSWHSHIAFYFKTGRSICRMDFQKPTLSTGLLVFLATFFIAEVWAEELTLHINLTHPLHVTTRNYLGVTVSSGQLRMGLIGYDFQ